MKVPSLIDSSESIYMYIIIKVTLIAKIGENKYTLLLDF